MSLILWNTNALVLAIAKKQISPNEKFHYLLFSNCMYTAAGYIAWLFVSPPNGWLFWYEGFFVLVITYFGLLRCRDCYDSASDDRLLENFVMLGVPLGLKLILFTWLAHASIGLGMQWIVPHLTVKDESSIKLVNFLLSATHQFYAFLIAAIGTGAYFLRMSIHLRTITRDANST